MEIRKIRSGIAQFVRRVLSSSIINWPVMTLLHLCGIDGEWIRDRFFRVGTFSRDGVTLVGANWEPVAASVFWDGLYGFEPEMSHVFSSDLRVDSVVLDIGAHVGYYSVLAGMAGGRVVAFEPNPAARCVLRQHLVLNGLDVTVIPMAVSDALGTAKLHIPAGGTDSGASLDDAFGGTTVEVGLCSIDDIVEVLQLRSVDILKIDAERHEEFVLRGAQDTIQRFRPIVYLECLPDQEGQALAAMLKDYDFHLLTDRGPVRQPRLVPNSRWRNYRCVPSQKCNVISRSSPGSPEARPPQSP